MAEARKAKLVELLALVNSAAEQAFTEHDKMGHGMPSLDVEHGSDCQQDTVELSKAVKTLEGACDQLVTTLAKPRHTMIRRAFSLFEHGSLRAAVKLGVADVLANHPNGLHITKLAEETSADARKLGKVLRLLATRHCFREVTPDVFANSRLSLTLCTTKHSNLIDFITTECQQASCSLYEALVDPEYANSAESSKSPFMYSVKNEGITGSLFDWCQAHPDRAQAFGIGMVDWSAITNANVLVDEYPWKDAPSGTTVCDVGGGVGSLSMALAKTYPHLNVTLQDRPETLERAKARWQTECPIAIEEKRVDFIPVNFFAEMPRQGQDIYTLRYIIHDWPEPEALSILGWLRKAMHKDSRLLIQDLIVQSLTPEADDPLELSNHTAKELHLKSAPDVLLPNFGAGGILEHLMDINMLCMLNAGERTIAEAVALGKRAGLQLVKVWDWHVNGVLEFKVAEGGEDN